MEIELSNLTIEQSLESINQIIAALEGGTLTLEESMQQFEVGIRLINQCTAMIDKAEKQMKILKESGVNQYVFTENERKNSEN